MATYLVDSPSGSDVHVKTDAVFPIVLAGLFVLVYLQGYIQRMGMPRETVKVLLEVPVFVILLHLINRGNWQATPGFLLIALYAFWSILSAIYNGDGMYSAILYCRYVVYAYIIFTAVWSTPLTRTTVLRINTIIALVFLLQIAASAYEVFVRGERIEAHVGTLYADGGGLATEFPLFAMGLTVPFYLCCRRNPLLLVLSWAFFLVGYASGKRAIYFAGPFLYFFILGWHIIRVRALSARKRSVVGALVFICLIPLLLLGISKSHAISQSHSSGALEQVAYALNAAAEYTTAEGQAGRTTGRTGTSRRVLSTLWTGAAETILFGWGPSTMRTGEEGRYEALMITYGICGWTRDVICIGWPAMLAYVLFHLQVFRCLRCSTPPGYSGYWRAIRFGAEIAFLVTMISYIGYSSVFPAGGQLSYVYFYVLALLVSPRHRHIIGGAS